MYNKIQFKIIALILLITAIFVFGLLSLRNTENKNISLLLKGRAAERDTIIRKIIELKSKSLLSYVYDYSYWDEMVGFSKTLDEKWATENIKPSVETFDVDAIWLYNNDLSEIYSYNKKNDRTFKLPLTREDLKSVVNKSPFAHFFVYTNYGLMEVSIAPLQPGSDLSRVTPALGYYIGGRLWTKEYLDNLYYLTNSKINLIPIGSYDKTDKSHSDFEFINEIDLKDWNGSTLTKINAVSTSTTIKEFLAYGKFLYASIIVFIILIIILISLYLYKLLNKPLKAITLSLAKENPEPLKEMLNKKSEFGEMARLINEFFENKNSLIAEIVMRTKAEDELIKKQDELIKAKEKAEELSRLKSNLLANLSHEFRTPLSGIIGISELLKDEIRDEEQYKLLNDISISGKRLHETLNSILLLAQFESANIAIHREKFNLSSELVSYLEKYRYKAEEKNLELKIAIEDYDLFADTDRDLLKNVIYNLYDNAVKFTDKGSIKIKLSSRIRDGNLNAEISIADSGIGISKDYINIIYDEFRQASEGNTRKYEGTGLGLTLSKKILNILGGKIECISEPGIGSTFTICIPAFRILNIEIEPASEIQTDKKQLTEILFVEDNPSNQYVFKKFIENSCNVEFASTGEEAVNLANKKIYDLIFMDINLGSGIDGIEAMKQIKNIYTGKNVPIAALTGYAMEHDKELFLKNGFDYFIIKPFGRSDLMNVINEVISKK